MIHNNFNRYVEVSDMVFAKNLSAEARKLLDNHIGQDNVIDNPDKTKLLKILYETWSNPNDREKIGDLLPTMIIYARRFFMSSMKQDKGVLLLTSILGETLEERLTAYMDLFPEKSKEEALKFVEPLGPA